MGQNFRISLRPGQMGANPAPLTVSLTVKYPFFYDLPYPPRNLQTCCCPKMIEGIIKYLSSVEEKYKKILASGAILSMSCKYHKVNKCLARYSPRATTTNRPTNRALNKPAWPDPN